jgi:hypothetical protein
MKTYTKEEQTDQAIASLKGKMGHMRIEALEVAVRITDARRRFGHVDVLVEPADGSGEQWVEKHRVKVAN